MLEGWLRLLDLEPRFLSLGDKEIVLSDDPILGYELNPEHSEISSQGLRDREFEVEKEDGVFRIVALGDSITFGCCYYRRRATYPKRLERILNRGPSGKSFEVINAGITGYNTLQEAALFDRRLSRFDPDLILLQFTGNDFLSLTSSEAWETMKDRFAGLEGSSPEALAAARILFDSAQGAGRWLAQARIYRFAVYASSRFGRRAPKAEEVDFGRLTRAGEVSGDDELSWQRSDVVPRGFDLLRQAAGDKPVLVVFFPRLDDFDEPPFAGFFDFARRLATERGFDTLDLTDCFRRHDFKGTRMYDKQDILHPNEYGHRVAATCLGHWIDPRLPQSLSREEALEVWSTIQPRRRYAHRQQR